jgi:hypothetical protein
MVESIYFLKPAWYGTHHAGLWPEQGLKLVAKATALQAVAFTQGQLCVSRLHCSMKPPNAQSLAIRVMTQVQGIAASKASVQV